VGQVRRQHERESTDSCDSPAEDDDPHDHRQPDGADRRIDQRQHRRPPVASHQEEATDRDQRIAHHVRDVTRPSTAPPKERAQVTSLNAKIPSPAARRSQGARRSGRKHHTPTTIAMGMETTITSHTTSAAVPSEVRKYTAVASAPPARYVLKPFRYVSLIGNSAVSLSSRRRGAPEPAIIPDR